ncbi:hypothetical protein KUTeg_010283 [Tegillarca granosa]|uniref:NlpC/P60 domain-containing protein n=1 Tax=Tegillarca granosa TaxID=220873 RepID=A0ABQ9F9E5_TEGGR|nr:hypothetical protein KUTeg_010283 [Tegillarca granosa]
MEFVMPGSLKRKNNGVTASRIIREARKYNRKTDYSYKGCKHGYCDENKCNMYVNDMLKNAGAKVPKRRPFFYSPIGANEWGNPRSTYVLNTGCYKNVNYPNAGDVVAFPASVGSGHVGIVTGSGQYISAGEFIVEEKRIPNKTKVFWRYRYTKSGC